jgi:uncharacterized membrane protein (DUF4010 family)
MLIDTIIFQKVILSLALGGIIGLERERVMPKKSFAGVRTFMFVCLLGFISTYISQDILNNFLLTVLSFIAVCALTVLNYFNRTFRFRQSGMTTELAFLLTFFIGLLIYFEDYPYFFSVALSILLTFMLFIKDKLHSMIKHISKKEIWSAIIFAIIAFIVYPLMPNYAVDGYGVMNPHLIWTTLVIVLTISFAAYIAMKIFGVKRGIVLTGLFGGLASSTAVAVNMAENVKKNPKVLFSASFAVVIASSTMFLRMLFVSSLFNHNIALTLLVPLLLLGCSGYLLSFVIIKKYLKEKTTISIRSPLSLKLAFKFAVFFSFILIISKIGQTYFGSAGIYAVSLISGLVDVDALVVSLSTLSLSSISIATAAKGIVIASLSNTASKWFYVRWFGTKEMSFEVGRIFLVLIIQGILLLYFLGF